jgi:hypothetical protein
MNTKLTLTIEQHIIEKAKKYAKDNHRSLSSLIENYLKALTIDAEVIIPEQTPVVHALKGAFSAPLDVDYKKELTNRLTKKYL